MKKEQGGRFERLDEALREPDRQAVPVPVLGDPADLHLQMARWHIGIEHAQSFAQLALGFIRRAERRAVDIAVAVAAGQRDLPAPAVLQRVRNGLRGDIVADRCGHRDRGIVEQVVGEAHERRSHRLLDQQSAETGAVEKKIRAYRLAFRRDDGGDVAVLVQADVADVAGLVMHASLLGLLVQKLAQHDGSK